MGLHKKTKINKLMTNWPKSRIATSRWLTEHGYTRQLIRHYTQSGWLQKLAHGAYVRLKEKADWVDAVAALQHQLHYPAHIGGYSALALHGLEHYATFGDRPIELYLHKDGKRKFPKWLLDSFQNIKLNSSPNLPNDLGIQELTLDNKLLLASSPERAALEILSQVNSPASFEYAAKSFEGLQLLQPNLMQKLLEQHYSFKVKRLFLHLASELSLPTIETLDVSKIDLGKGKYVVANGSNYDSTYEISTPTVNFPGDIDV